MSTLSLFFLSLCRKFVSQWLVSASSQTLLLEDGPSASDYPYCSLPPSYYRLFWGLRAGSQAADNCGEALTPYIYPKNRMMESILEFFSLLCFLTVYVCGIYSAHGHVCVHMYASAHTDMKAGCPWRVIPYFLRQSLSLKLEPRIGDSGWTASPRNPPVSSHLHLLPT